MNFKFLIRLAGIWLLAGTVMADTMSWTNSAGGNWADTGNWDTTVPGANDVAEFNLDSATAYTVTNVTDGTINQQLRVAQDRVKLDLAGTTYTLTNLEAIIVGPENTTGTLEIVGGTLQMNSRSIYVGYKTWDEDPVQKGTLIIDGTTFINAENPSGNPLTNLRIGNRYDGNGTVIVRGGTKINQNWGIRYLTMNNSRVGGPSGSMIISDSGTEVIIAQINIGTYSPDDVSISTLVVTNGAKLMRAASYNSSLGNGGPGILTVTGADSLAQLTSQVDSFYIGKGTGIARGIIQVLDGGTVWDGLNWGNATQNDHDTYYGSGGSSHGSLLVEGTDSHYRVDHHEAHDTYFRTNCTLVVRDGGRVSTYRGSELFFEQGSSLGGDGRLEIDVNCSGMIKPGGTLQASAWYGVTSAPGTLTVTSNLTLSATALYDVELAGSNAAEYDRIVASNDVVLAGSIAISMIDGFTYSNALGHRYTVMEVGGTLSGAFSNAANGDWIETANPNESFQVHYGPASRFDSHLLVLTPRLRGTVVVIY